MERPNGPLIHDICQVAVIEGLLEAYQEGFWDGQYQASRRLLFRDVGGGSQTPTGDDV